MLRHVKYVLLQADTKPIELFCSLIGFAWGCWLNWSQASTLPMFWQALEVGGGVWTFKIAVWPAASVQIVGTFYRWPKWRKWASMLASVYWLSVVWALMRGNCWTLWHFWDASIMAVAQLLLVFQRSVLEPTAVKSVGETSELG